MELFTTILTAVLVAVIGVIGMYLSRNDQARAIAQVIDVLAKDAVVAVEKLNLNGELDGKAQAVKARHIVEHELHQLGFNNVQLEQIANAVEHAWAELTTNGTLDAYKKGTN